MGPKSNDGVLIKDRKDDTQRRLHEDGGRDWRQSHAATSQGIPKIASSHQEPGDRQGTDSPLEHPEGTTSADTLSLGCCLSYCEMINFCCFKSCSLG